MKQEGGFTVVDLQKGDTSEVMGPYFKCRGRTPRFSSVTGSDNLPSLDLRSDNHGSLWRRIREQKLDLGVGREVLRTPESENPSQKISPLVYTGCPNSPYQRTDATHSTQTRGRVGRSPRNHRSADRRDIRIDTREFRVTGDDLVQGWENRRKEERLTNTVRSR